MKPSMKKLTKVNLFCSGVFLSSLVFCKLAFAKPAEEIIIPVMAKAQIFAQFTDKLPAVINYFSKAPEQTIIEFYQTHYGKPEKKERKRGRLTLTFINQKNSIRVVISKQNRVHQVDVLVEAVKKI